jgi:hypothetical protein
VCKKEDLKSKLKAEGTIIKQGATEEFDASIHACAPRAKNGLSYSSFSRGQHSRLEVKPHRDQSQTFFQDDEVLSNPIRMIF